MRELTTFFFLGVIFTELTAVLQQCCHRGEEETKVSVVSMTACQIPIPALPDHLSSVFILRKGVNRKLFCNRGKNTLL